MSLPNSSEVVVEIFNASYAYYPNLLPAILSALFMKIAGIFTTDYQPQERYIYPMFPALITFLVLGLIMYHSE